MPRPVGDGFDVRSLAVTYREGHVLGDHTHPWGQLVYAKSGLMHVTAGQRLWIVPPTRALWVPAGQSHRIEFRGETALRTLYIANERTRSIERGVETLAVAPVLSEIILHILKIGMLDPGVKEHDHLASVLIDLVRAAPVEDLALPVPSDARAQRIAKLIQDNPADPRRLSELARMSGASLRTLQRRFQQETGLSLEGWRQKSRLVHSVAMLTRGASVTATALDCGYESPSAFIAAFRKHYGTTPGRFCAGPATSAD